MSKVPSRCEMEQDMKKARLSVFQDLKVKIAAIEERGFNDSDVPDLVIYAKAVLYWNDKINA